MLNNGTDVTATFIAQTKDFPRIVDLRSNSFDIWCSKYVLDYETNKKTHTITFAITGNEDTKTFNCDEFLNHIVF